MIRLRLLYWKECQWEISFCCQKQEGFRNILRITATKYFLSGEIPLKKNIRDAFLSYDQDKAPHRYENSANHFGEERYYRELAEAVDVS